jgi:hypothetical protein
LFCYHVIIEERRGKIVNKLILPIFWSLLGTFLLLFFVMQLPMLPPVRESINSTLSVNFVPTLFLFSGALFLLLSLTLLILAIRAELDKTLKRYLILTGASAAGILVSIVLHNLAYGVFSHFFGEDFWQRTGLEDEPFFFLMAIIVCPIAYLVGTVGSIVLITRRKGGFSIGSTNNHPSGNA